MKIPFFTAAKETVPQEPLHIGKKMREFYHDNHSFYDVMDHLQLLVGEAGPSGVDANELGYRFKAHAGALQQQGFLCEKIVGKRLALVSRKPSFITQLLTAGLCK